MNTCKSEKNNKSNLEFDSNSNEIQKMHSKANTVCPIKNVFCLRVYCGSMIYSEQIIPSILASIYIKIQLFNKYFENIAFLYYFLDLKITQNSINSEFITNFF